jgi:hypothetical protein
MSPDQDRQRRDQLEPDAQAALGNVSPELAWLQIEAMLAQCVVEYYQAAEELRLRMNLPVDLTNLQELASDWKLSPVRAVNEFHYANPSFNLKDVPAQEPLKVLEALLRMLMLNDRLQAPKPTTPVSV